MSEFDPATGAELTVIEEEKKPQQLPDLFAAFKNVSAKIGEFDKQAGDLLETAKGVSAMKHQSVDILRATTGELVQDTRRALSTNRDARKNLENIHAAGPPIVSNLLALFGDDKMNFGLQNQRILNSQAEFIEANQLLEVAKQSFDNTNFKADLLLNDRKLLLQLTKERLANVFTEIEMRSLAREEKEKQQALNLNKLPLSEVERLYLGVKNGELQSEFPVGVLEQDLMRRNAIDQNLRISSILLKTNTLALESAKTTNASNIAASLSADQQQLLQTATLFKSEALSRMNTVELENALKAIKDSPNNVFAAQPSVGAAVPVTEQELKVALAQRTAVDRETVKRNAANRLLAANTQASLIAKSGEVMRAAEAMGSQFTTVNADGETEASPPRDIAQAMAVMETAAVELFKVNPEAAAKAVENRNKIAETWIAELRKGMSDSEKTVFNDVLAGGVAADRTAAGEVAAVAAEFPTSLAGNADLGWVGANQLLFDLYQLVQGEAGSTIIGTDDSGILISGKTSAPKPIDLIGRAAAKDKQAIAGAYMNTHVEVYIGRVLTQLYLEAAKAGGENPWAHLVDTGVAQRGGSALSENVLNDKRQVSPTALARFLAEQTVADRASKKLSSTQAYTTIFSNALESNTRDYIRQNMLKGGITNKALDLVFFGNRPEILFNRNLNELIIKRVMGQREDVVVEQAAERVRDQELEAQRDVLNTGILQMPEPPEPKATRYVR